MQFKKLLLEEDGVSPVIGVVLMVGITVILAAVIASFVLGMGDQIGNTAPQASFSFDYSAAELDNDTLVIAHDGGDIVAAGQLNATVSGAVDSNNGDASLTYNGTAFGSSGDVAAGQTYELNETVFQGYGGGESHVDLTGATVRITWTGEGGSSSTLATWKGPDA